MKQSTVTISSWQLAFGHRVVRIREYAGATPGWIAKVTFPK